MRETKIVILRGNSGCGKSSTARLLQRKLGHGAMLLSQDVVRREMLYVKDGPDTEAKGLLINLLNFAKENCEIVILEGILNSNWYKELFEEVKDSYEKNIFAYYFDVSFEETLRRHKTKPNAHEFGKEEMRRWWNEMDLIGFIQEDMVTEDMNQEEIVEKIYEDINNK